VALGRGLAAPLRHRPTTTNTGLTSITHHRPENW
jgi:hypothetical protein